LITFISYVLVFGIIVFFHELGHFAVAKIHRIKVLEFALGFGPKLYSKKFRETEYGIRAFPLGGFVKMEGEDTLSDDPRSFINAAAWKRFTVLLAGPVMNFFLAVIVFSIVMVGIGFPVNVVGELIPDMPAYESGLFEPGDQIIEINGVETTTWNDVTAQIAASEALDFVLLRDEKTVAVHITAMRDAENTRYVIGIRPATQKDVPRSLQLAVTQTWNMSKDVLGFLASLPKGGQSGVELIGPVGMATMVGEAARGGIFNLLALTGLFSINLGIFNLLPLPALDGGRIFFVLIEVVFRRKIDKEKEGMVHLAGFALLMALMIFVLYKDIIRLFQ
jgi:regulator of sigma E protease